MTNEEKRRHYRVDSQNLLNFVCYDEKGTIFKQGMGRTLNVSETGILLETHILIEKKTVIGLTIGLKEDLVDLKGEVVYSKPGGHGKFESGIRFQNIDEAGLVALEKYIAAFKASES
jgi:hypothetical protein